METMRILHLFLSQTASQPPLYHSLPPAAGLDVNPPQFAHFLRRSLQKLERYQTPHEGNANARRQKRVGAAGQTLPSVIGSEPAPEVQPAGVSGQEEADVH